MDFSQSSDRAACRKCRDSIRLVFANYYSASKLCTMPNVSKRKRDQMEDEDDDDEPSLGRQILPVANLPDDFDGEPMDGMQYLFTVR